RRDEGDGRDRRPCTGRAAAVGAPRISGLADERLALHPDAVLHGGGEPLPDLQHHRALTATSAAGSDGAAFGPPRRLEGPTASRRRESRGPASCPPRRPSGARASAGERQDGTSA